MSKQRLALALALTLLPPVSGVAFAQERPSPSPAQARPDGVAQLKVTVVISRFQGDKKVGSLPYMFTVTSGPRDNVTSLRMGSEVPIVRTMVTADGKQPPNVSYNYRNLGANIDCVATSPIEGLYRLGLTIEDTSVHVDSSPATPAQRDGIPSFRTFKTSFAALLRDGQTMQNTSAADPVTGEVMKVDVMLNVVK